MRQRLISANIPIVETWDMTPTPIDMLVGFSHENVGEAVARHLLASGHRRVRLDLGGRRARARAPARASWASSQRQDAHDAEVVTVAAPSTLTQGRHGLADALRAGREAHAVFCGSDLLAHGALEEARSRGLSVPGDVALIGFGGLEFAQHTYPALSTVRVDRAAIGRRAAEVILARIGGETPSEKVIDVGFTIVDRQTT